MHSTRSQLDPSTLVGEPRCRDPLEDQTTTIAADRYVRLTPSNALLVLIDQQIGPLWELEYAASRRRVVDLATVGRRLALPIVMTAIAPETWGPIIPELAEVLDGIPVAERCSVNAWDDAGVRRAIEEGGRTKLIISGSVLDVAVAMCAQSAARAGYEVYVPIDASGQASHAAVSRLCREGIIITTTALVASELLTGRADERQGSRIGVERLSPDEALKRRLRTWRLRG